MQVQWGSLELGFLGASQLLDPLLTFAELQPLITGREKRLSKGSACTTPSASLIVTIDHGHFPTLTIGILRV